MSVEKKRRAAEAALAYIEAGMVLLRPGNRLSITPVEAAHWKFILSLE